MAPPVERVIVAQPVPIGGGSVIASPFQFLLTGEDTLLLTTWCSVVNIAVIVGGRVLRADGTIEPFAFRFPVPSTRTVGAFPMNVGSGFLLNLGVIATPSPLVSGECFVSLRLVRGHTGGTTYLGTLVQGYITNTQGLAWPGSPIQLSTDGPGVLRQFTGTNPAAGVDIDEVVPTGARWELISIYSLLTTDATAGTRRAILRLETAAGGIFAESRPAGTIGPSNVGGYIWSQGMPLETAIGGFNAGVSGLPTNATLIAGNHILMVTVGMAAGDNWQAPDVVVREWLEANT